MRSEQSYLVSAIVSTYNSEKFIRGRLDDLLQQTIADKLEIIIVNSGSQQNEDTIIKSEYLPQYSNIKYIHTENRETIYKAWNRGIKIAKGKFITNANTDDRLRNNALEILSDALDKNAAASLAYADQFIHHSPNLAFHQIKSPKKFHRQPYDHVKLLLGYIVGPQSMWRRSLHFQENIWFNENYEVAGDYDFVLQVAEKSELMYVDDTLGAYYKSDNNSNKEFSDLNRTIDEVATIQEKYARRYLKMLGEYELEVVRKKMYERLCVPKIFYQILARLRQNNPFYSYYHLCWFYSLISETMGDIETAKKYCERVAEYPNAPLVYMQQKHLTQLK